MATDPLAVSKTFFRIGEVSSATGIAAHVLRYWEEEFPQLKPRKGRGGQRLYTRKDVALIRRIHQLVHEQRFTIEGARKALSQPKASAPDAGQFDLWITELESIRTLLNAEET